MIKQEKVLKEADIQLQTVGVGEITYPPGGTLGPRFQTDLQLVFVHAGQMRVLTDDKQFLVAANNAILLLPGHIEEFSFAKSQETTHSWVQGPINLLTEPARLYMESLPRPIILSSTLRNLMSEALRLKGVLLQTDSPILKAIATYMFWQYLGEAKQLSAAHEGKSASQTVEKARGFMHRNLEKHLSVEMIANTVNISRSQLTRLFKAELNITPMAYLWQQRVTLGIDMLRNTGLPVGIIADRSGFKNRYHFSRSVRQATQMSPSELRRSWWRGGK